MSSDNNEPRPIRIRPVREITAEEENFRVVPLDGSNNPRVPAIIRRDMVKPEREGTIVMMPFVITGYDRDCDGAALARLSHVDRYSRVTGWTSTSMGLDPSSCWVLDSLNDLPK